MKNKNVYKVAVIAALTAMLGGFTHCLLQGPSLKSTTGRAPTSSNSEQAPPPSPGQVISQIQVTTGIKNHEQILMTMESLTGVSHLDPAIQATYTQVASSLPSDNEVKSFLSPHQVAITKLAAEYCNSLVNSTTLRTAVWPTFNFNTPLNSFNTALQDTVIQNTMDAFWGVGMVSASEESMNRDELIALIAQVTVGEPNTAASTMNAVKSVCTAVLSSAHVTLL